MILLVKLSYLYDYYAVNEKSLIRKSLSNSGNKPVFLVTFFFLYCFREIASSTSVKAELYPFKICRQFTFFLEL